MKLLSQGGLGNQLFLLNFAHQLRSENKKNVHLITRNLSQEHSDRMFEVSHVLDNCSHGIKYKTSDLPFDAYNLLDRAKIFQKSNSDTIQQKFSFVNVTNPFSAPSTLRNSSKYIRGYFQSAESVNKHLPIYLQEIYSAIDKKVNQKEIIQKTERYQAIHIRRGDFVNSKKSIGLLALSYYRIGTEHSLPIKIVTDADSNFINEINRIFPESEIYGSDSMDTWQAFNLLANASHLQIANSTFSWWAGVIANFKGAKVSAPTPWNLAPQEGVENLSNPNFTYRKAVFE